MKTAATVALGGLLTCGTATGAVPFSTPQERCIAPAATYHRVNPYVLLAILRVESGLNPSAINRNDNGTYDLGMGQMNSMHFRELAAYGIAPGHLLDSCVATYVAAWHLAGITRVHGNTWSAIARYHSATPYFNYRYQVLLTNELVRMGALAGQLRAVPPLKPSEPATKGAKASAPAAIAFDASAP